MKDSCILKNFVAAIHSLRAGRQCCNSSLTDEDDEVEDLTDLVLVLESQLDTFGDLEVVKRLQSIISKNLGESALVDSAIQDGISINVQKSVFECVRKDILIEITGVIQLLEDDSSELLQIDFEVESAHKKKKNEGYFTSFNFDDLPEYEPLELTLKLLRATHCNEHAIQKILDSDMDELVEHPQWKELLLLVRFSLYNGNEQCKILSLHLHIRLASELPELQAGEVIVNLLNYFLDSWKLLEGSQGHSEVHKFGVANQNEIYSLNSLSRIQVSIFVALLRIISEKNLSPSMETEGDHIIATLFILLTQAVVPVISAEQNKKDELKIPVHSDLSSFVSLMDVLAIFTVESGGFVTTISRRRHPSAVLSHAVQSGLLGTLYSELKSMIEHFHDLQPSSFYLASSIYCSGRIVLYSQMLLSFLLPFASNKDVVRTCVQSVSLSSAISGMHSKDHQQMEASQYLWNGDKVSRENVRFKESFSTEVLQSMGNCSVSMVFDPLVNKLMSQLSGAKSILEVIIPDLSIILLESNLAGDLMDISSVEGISDDGKGEAIGLARSSLPTDDISIDAMLLLIAQSLKTIRQCQLHQKGEGGASNTGLETVHIPLIIDDSSSTHCEDNTTASLENLLGLIVRFSFSSSASNIEIITECASFAIQQFDFAHYSFLKTFLEALDGAISSADREVVVEVIQKVICITDTILDKLSKCRCENADIVQRYVTLEVINEVLSAIFKLWSHILKESLMLVHVCDSSIAEDAEEKRISEDGKKSELSKKSIFAACVARLVVNCLLSLGVERGEGEPSKLSYVEKLKKEIMQQKNVPTCTSLNLIEVENLPIPVLSKPPASIAATDYNGYSPLSYVAIELLIAIIHACSDEPVLVAALIEHDLVSDIVSAIAQSLSLSSIKLQEDRDGSSLPCYALPSQEETRTSYDSRPESPCSPSQSLLRLIPTFNDCRSLKSSLLSAMLVFGDDAISALFSWKMSQEFIYVLRKEETSPYVWETSMSFSEADGKSSSSSSQMIPLLQLFLDLISSGIIGLADRIISVCVEAWEPLKEYCEEKNFLVNTDPQNGETVSPALYEGIASKLLGQVAITGSLNGVEYEGIGPYIIRLLYCFVSTRSNSCEVNNNLLRKLLSDDSCGTVSLDSNVKTDLSSLYSPAMLPHGVKEESVDTYNIKNEDLDSRREGFDMISLLQSTILSKSTSSKTDVPIQFFLPSNESQLDNLLIFVSQQCKQNGML